MAGWRVHQRPREAAAHRMQAQRALPSVRRQQSTTVVWQLDFPPLAVIITGLCLPQPAHGRPMLEQRCTGRAVVGGRSWHRRNSRHSSYGRADTPHTRAGRGQAHLRRVEPRVRVLRRLAVGGVPRGQARAYRQRGGGKTSAEGRNNSPTCCTRRTVIINRCPPAARQKRTMAPAKVKCGNISLCCCQREADDGADSGAEQSLHLQLHPLRSQCQIFDGKPFLE